MVSAPGRKRVRISWKDLDVQGFSLPLGGLLSLTIHPIFTCSYLCPFCPLLPICLFVDASTCGALGICGFHFCLSLSSDPCMHLDMGCSEDQKSWLLSDCQPKAFPWACSTPVFTLCFVFSFVSGLRTSICCPKLQPISEVQMMEKNKVNPRSSY